MPPKVKPLNADPLKAKIDLQKVKRTSKILKHAIPKSTAKTMVQTANANEQMYAVDFAKEDILELLNQPLCTGLRIYRALTTDLQKTYVLTGVDASGSDVFIPRTSLDIAVPVAKGQGAAKVKTTVDDDYALDLGQICDPVMQIYSNINMLTNP